MRSALPPELTRDPLRAVRSGCSHVAERARFVRIDREGLERYAEQLDLDAIRSAATSPPVFSHPSAEICAAFTLSLDAVNFGSGYFPQLRKRPGLSGYRTIEAGLLAQFEAHGPLGAADLAKMDAQRCARIFGQSLGSAPVRELMAHYAQAWRELGELLRKRHAGRFLGVVEAAEGRAAALIGELLRMPMYQDVARYGDQLVAFFKRAQISVADLARALPNDVHRLRDLDRLTAFADNLVAHVLRLDGILHYDPGLAARIDAAQLLVSGSIEEVEIRACSVHAVELLSQQPRLRSGGLRPHELDAWLWQRGAQPEFKARPRHRTRSVFY